MHLTRGDIISMSQCFNLAHAELLHLGLADKLSEGGQDTYLTDRTMALFELKNNITRKLKDKYEVPEQQEGGELINQLLIKHARRMHLHKAPEVLRTYEKTLDNRIAGDMSFTFHTF